MGGNRMEFKITTICENTVPTSMFQLGEHGLSMLIEVGEDKILFDTGQTNTLIHNARFLGIDLTKINKVVLSHGHFDHTGGLLELLKINKNFQIFAHPDIFYLPKYAKRKGNYIYIGPNFKKEQLEREGIKINLSREPIKINEYIITTGEIKRLTDFEEIEKELLVKENNEFKKDPLLDDLSLILKTEKGIVVLLGCAHSGVINKLIF
jgi:7,8-dihydropterin-6-yl-methyl-4-(beta-D-ribofuranosyl)aminobenzene 5'-phosphate synthase